MRFLPPLFLPPGRRIVLIRESRWSEQKTAEDFYLLNLDFFHPPPCYTTWVGCALAPLADLEHEFNFVKLACVHSTSLICLFQTQDGEHHQKAG